MLSTEEDKAKQNDAQPQKQEAMMVTALLPEEQYWQALEQHDPAADGQFWYAVITTGIYCRPTCTSRPPKRANVRFFTEPRAAEEAGFRPCKRCNPQVVQPEHPHRAVVMRACALLDAGNGVASLAELADAAGFSPFHFHRIFRAVVGVTPKQYALTRRAALVQIRLQQEATVTEAMSNTGYTSSSRFYESGTRVLGMTPTAFRAGAPGEQIRSAIVPCYLGWALVAATDRGLCAIEFGDAPDVLDQRLHARFPNAIFVADDAGFAATVAEVIAFIETPNHHLELPLDIQGTAFQQRVWAALRTIPAGTTTSYGAIAAQIGQPGAVRAVANACATNPIAVAIPCHRVVRGDGAISGYRWGVDRKRALLERETPGQ